jgi:hypothetical protein
MLYSSLGGLTLVDQIAPDFSVLSVESGDIDKIKSDGFFDATADLTQPGNEPHLEDISMLKERGASNVAARLLLVFGHSLVWPFVGGVFLIVVLSMKYEPNVAVKLLNDGYLPLLERIGDLALRVFGPLLGFVLGYYFGTKGR